MISSNNILVVRAANVFYVGTTNIPLDPQNPAKAVPSTTTSKQLSFVSEPEEKRKIIGDVFMHVSWFMRFKIIPW